MGRIDFDTDLKKHYVRHNGWKQAFSKAVRTVENQINNENRKREFKYLTFCASNAIDVFMLEKGGLLKRDNETKRIDNVYFCEYDQHEFNKISTLIGSKEAGFFGTFEDIMLFEDDVDTKEIDEIDESITPSREFRRKFYLKRLHRKMKNSFPFDIINFDPYGVLFPPKRRAKLLQSLDLMFKWQNNTDEIDGHKINDFTLFVTLNSDKESLDEVALSKISDRLLENINKNDDFRDFFKDSFNNRTPWELLDVNEINFFIVGFLKCITLACAINNNWYITKERCFYYKRPHSERYNRKYGSYYMLSYVFKLKKFSEYEQALPHQPGTIPKEIAKKYWDMIIGILSKTDDVDNELETNADCSETIKNDLSDIISFRDDFFLGL